MENKDTLPSVAQIVQHRNENYKLLMLLKSENRDSNDIEFIKQLESKIQKQDEQIRQMDKDNLYMPNEI